MAVVMSSGIMIAVPSAWITRAVISTVSVGLSAAISVPRLNSDMAQMNTGRV